MIRCETCSHECSMVDFVHLRNVCEHLYLDSLAKSRPSFVTFASNSLLSKRAAQDLLAPVK